MNISKKEYFIFLPAALIILCLLNALFHMFLSVSGILIVILFISFVLGFKKHLSVIGEKILQIDEKWIFIIATFLSLLSVLLIKPQLFDDPLYLINQVKSDIETGTVKFSDPYSIRNLFYLYPIVKIFGYHLLIIKIFNFIFFILAGLLFYAILKINYREKPAISKTGIIIFFMIPYYYLLIDIPHYDTPATFYLMVCLFLLTRIFNFAEDENIYNIQVFIYSGLLGLATIFLVYTRGLLIPVVITVTLFILLSLITIKGIKVKGRIIIFSLVIPALVFTAFNILLKSSDLVDTNYTEGRSAAQMVFSYNDTRFDGTTEHHDKKWVYFKQIPENLENRYAFSKLNAEIYFNWPWYLYRLSSKSAELYKVGGDYRWITGDSSGSKLPVKGLHYFELILQITLILFAFCGLTALIYRKERLSLFLVFSIIFVFTCSFFSIFSEVRSRYIFIFIYGIILFASIGLKSFQTVITDIARKPKKLILLLAACFILLGAGFFLYRTVIACNNTFASLSDISFRKNIGQVNLSAFQKKITAEDPTVTINNRKNKSGMSFFIRTDSSNCKSFNYRLISGNDTVTKNIPAEKFETLKSDNRKSISFTDINIKMSDKRKIVLDFSANNLTRETIIEYCLLH